MLINIFLKEMYFDSNLTEFVPKSPINNKSGDIDSDNGLVLNSHKPLPKPTLNKISDAYGITKSK